MAKIFWQVKRNKSLISILIFLSILLLGNKLREYHYASVPLPGEVADEYSFGWLGISLIKDGYPIAWSGIDTYKNHDYQKINVDGLFDKDPHRPLFSIDKPWFDHPPLFGLMTGGYAYLKGIREFKDASVIILRRPMLKIAIITTLLLFILGTRLYGISVGLLSAFLYSIVPTTVISSRLALAENGIIPIFLGALILADIYLEKRAFVFWYGASALSAFAILFKFSGISVFIALFLIALKYGGEATKKLLTTSTLFLFFAILTIFVYAAIFDLSTFINVLVANSQRFYGAGSEIFFQAIAHSKITTERYSTDGWILMGWISLFLLSFLGWTKERPAVFLTLSVFSYLIVFLLFGSESYGWYRFPFYPFLAISIASIFKKLIDSPNLFLAISFLLLPFGTVFHRLIGIESFQNYVPFFRGFAVIALLLMLKSFLTPERSLNLQRVFILACFVFVSFLSIQEILFYTVENWYFVT